MTNHKKIIDVTASLPFFLKRNDILKIDQSVKMPLHTLSISVACSYSSAPGCCDSV